MYNNITQYHYFGFILRMAANANANAPIMAVMCAVSDIDTRLAHSPPFFTEILV